MLDVFGAWSSLPHLGVALDIFTDEDTIYIIFMQDREPGILKVMVV